MDQAKDYLKKDPVLHVDMLECIRRGSARILAASRSGVLLCDESSGTHMLSAKSEEAALRMIAGLDSSDLFVAHQTFGTAAAQQKFGFCQRLLVCNAAYCKKEPLPGTDRPAEIRRMDESFLPFVKEHYRTIPEEEYLRDRLRSGTVFGAFVKGEPAGFIGVHAEGAMGMLEVLPRFRRRGIARMLESHLINHLLKDGAFPYAQIKGGNEASEALHRALGFCFSKDSVSWLMR
ncbi:MAG: GNAT family N-acetyltransferase [Oscillospiraceae bacterium]|jgi:tRNA (guanine37-N1)-methyltransferase|nr:GNAT family N-acetyltransferase [Oscillospiraceae bacterium]